MLNDVRAFLDVGGFAMVVLAAHTFVMWVLLLDRIFYLMFAAQRDIVERLAGWYRRQEHGSWYALQIRRQLLSEVREKLGWSFPVIKGAVAVCPMIGLLGTVTGMIEIFASMTVNSGDNPRALAAGVSKAMTTTLAGMVAALSGMVAQAMIFRRAALHLVSFECDLNRAIETVRPSAVASNAHPVRVIEAAAGSG